MLRLSRRSLHDNPSRLSPADPPDRVSHPPAHPSPDPLQLLLGSVQALGPEAFPSLNQQAQSPDLPSLDETLQWEPDGRPTWWPHSRPLLLQHLRENLPARFPNQPTTHFEQQQLVAALHHTHGALHSGALDIPSSS